MSDGDHTWGIQGVIQAVNGRRARPTRDFHPEHQNEDLQHVYARSLVISENDEYTTSHAPTGDAAPVHRGFRPRRPPMTADSIREFSSTASSSVFDQGSEYVTEPSPAPSRIGDAHNPPPAPSPPPVYLPMHGINAPERFLPCELAGFGCTVRFPLYQVSDWIRHLEIEHLRDTYPSNSVCWFCDSRDNEEFRAASNSYADRKLAFQRRMYHVASHFEDGPSRGPRPDWYLLPHLRDIGEIDEESFRVITQYSERPDNATAFPWDRTPSARSQPSYMQPDRGEYFRKRPKTNYKPQ